MPERCTREVPFAGAMCARAACRIDHGGQLHTVGIWQTYVVRRPDNRWEWAARPYDSGWSTREPQAAETALVAAVADSDVALLVGYTAGREAFRRVINPAGADSDGHLDVSGEHGGPQELLAWAKVWNIDVDNPWAEGWFAPLPDSVFPEDRLWQLIHDAIGIDDGAVDETGTPQPRGGTASGLFLLPARIGRTLLRQGLRALR